MNSEVVKSLSAILHDRTQRGWTQVGWKLGFGSDQGKQLLGIDRPLVAGLFDVGQRASGSVIDVSHLTNAMVEPELAAWIDRSCSAGASEEEVLASVGGIVPAIELADVSFTPQEPISVVAGNIYQENWVAGEQSSSGWRKPDDLRVLVESSTEKWEQPDPQSMTGSLVEGLLQCHSVAHAVGRGLLAGDIVFLGSVIPPQKVVNGKFSVHLAAGGSVEVQFEGAHG